MVDAVLKIGRKTLAKLSLPENPELQKDFAEAVTKLAEEYSLEGRLEEQFKAELKKSPFRPWPEPDETDIYSWQIERAALNLKADSFFEQIEQAALDLSAEAERLGSGPSKSPEIS